MAVAAFKSSSRRGNSTSTSTTVASSSSARQSREEARKTAPIRRSRSVTAFSRNISSDFVNKRDNPLFWSSSSPKDKDKDDNDGPIPMLEGCAYKVDQTNSTASTSSGTTKEDFGSATWRRGRSVRRDDDVSCKEQMVGRSLDSGRRTRSASQVPLSRRRYSTSESEAEQDCSKTISKDKRKFELPGSNGRSGLSRRNNDVVSQMKKLQTWSSQHSTFTASDNSAAILSRDRENSIDAVSLSTSSVCDSEEKTIKEVCERMKSVPQDMLEASDIFETVRFEVRHAIFEIQNDLESAIRRSNTTAVALTNVADIPPDLVNPGAVELVLEIRREYSKKLEESQERARKLRADLAVEEHRTQELGRILKEVLPYPKTPNVPKSRPRKQASIERRKMSRSLAEDAMAYFDECVSLSPFDSSDFSSQDDPPLNLFESPIPSDSHLPEVYCSPEQSITSHVEVSQTNQISSNPTESVQDQLSPSGSNFRFSFVKKPFDTSEPHHGIQEYIKNFDKNVIKLSNVRSSNYNDLERYDYKHPAEKFLTDSVLMKNRIESGSLLLCGGGNLCRYLV